MGADDERRRAGREPAEDRLARLALVAAGQQDDLDPGGARQWLEGVEVLARQDFGGRHEGGLARSEEHTSELQSLMRNSYAVFCLKKKNYTQYCKYYIQMYL